MSNDFEREISKFDFCSIPSGYVRDIATFIYKSAPYPIYETALLGALGLMAGICGRAFNVSGMGLNLYLLFVGPTGIGKDAMKQGIDKLVYSISGFNTQMSSTHMPSIREFIGPAHIASGQALLKHFKRSKCFVSCLGEFGLELQRICSPKAASHEIMFRKVLTDMYTRSGRGSTFDGMAYASDDVKLEPVLSPAVSFIGDAQRENIEILYNSSTIAQGLTGRILTLEYQGNYTEEFNPDHAKIKPPEELRDQLMKLAMYAVEQNQQNNVYDIQIDPDAAAAFEKFRKIHRAKLANYESDNVCQIEARVAQIAQKIAALVSINNAGWPTVTIRHAVWAMQLVEYATRSITSKLERGEIGENASEQQRLNAVLSAVFHLVTQKDDKYGMTKLMREKCCVSQSSISQKILKLACFKRCEPYRTSSEALHATIRTLCDRGELKQLTKPEALDFAINGKMYQMELSAFATVSGSDPRMMEMIDKTQRENLAYREKRREQTHKEMEAYFATKTPWAIKADKDN
jgi:hypothetical protein